ncbi:putative sugar O-methyltransferase [Candidatus Pelagibacter ubique]|nr:putative sugar O-methyltransferase [Candidatus Pelagibacter ubique]
MIKYQFSNQFIERYQKFLSSEEFKIKKTYTKSEYWQYQSDQTKISISGNTITASGKSGFYVPNTLKSKFSKFISNPLLLISFLKRKFEIPEIKLLNYFLAFEKVMNSDPISDPDLSPHRVNFHKLKENKKVISSIKDMKKKYFAKNKFPLNNHMVAAYYYYNLLCSYIDLDRKKMILDIGPGNGNLISLLHSEINNSKIIAIDLPETLSSSILFISNLFPEAKILMPHEAKSQNFNLYDFVFLTPSQIDLLNDNSIDLTINSHSFQEMTHEQINEYFQLIQRIGKNDSHFFTSNRAEKIPCDVNSYIKESSALPNRFAEYPWHKNNHLLIYEISRFHRLVQLDNIYLRLEQIKK